MPIMTGGTDEMGNLIKRLKDMYTASNYKWHMEQQRQAAIEQQLQFEQYKQLMENAGHVFLLFFRPILNQISYFDTTGMRCDVVSNYYNQYRLCLQVPLRVSCQAELPRPKTLAQLIENLISTECIQRRNQLYNRAYSLQLACNTPATIMEYNKSVQDNICSFMNYCVGIYAINAFKAVLVADCVLDTDTMNSFFI